MNNASRYFVITIGGIFVLVGLGFISYNVFSLLRSGSYNLPDWLPLLVGLTFGGLFVGLGVGLPKLILRSWNRIDTNHQAMLEMMAAQSYKWYRESHPTCVTENSVVCHSCGSTHVQVRGMGNHTYYRQHFCRQCGTALYYSPEFS